MTRLIVDSHDEKAFSPVASMTAGALRDHLLSHEVDAAALARLAPGLTPEMAAAVSKLMRNQDLIAVARKCRVVTAFRNTIGLRGPPFDPAATQSSRRRRQGHRRRSARRAGAWRGRRGDRGQSSLRQVGNAMRLMDMLDEIRETATRSRPRPACSPMSPTRSTSWRGARRSIWCSSRWRAARRPIAGSASILALLDEAHAAACSLGRGTVGQNVMYFETGQGSALSAEAHHGVDQQTMEARAYAVARRYKPLLVNTVVGFIGPEYLYDGKQIIRAALEDQFCGKLLGLPMGCDVCYTNHAEADQDDMDNLLRCSARPIAPS